MKKYGVLSFFMVICLMVLLLTSCDLKEKTPYTYTFFSFDTFCTISIYEDISPDKAKGVIKEIEDRVNFYDKKLSRFDKDSELYMVNNNAGEKSIALSPELFDIFQKSVEASIKTEGIFDITLGNISDMWDFNGTPQKPDENSLSALAGKENYKNIILDKENMTVFYDGDFTVDFGGIAKGYVTDIIKKMLADSGINSAVVDFGGNVLTMGSNYGEQFKVGISGGQDNSLVDTVSINEGIFSTSNSFQRFAEIEGEIHSHIIDPRTALPAKSDIQSCTVLCDNGITADVYSTTAYIYGSGYSEILDKEGIDYIIVKTDGRVIKSAGLK